MWAWHQGSRKRRPFVILWSFSPVHTLAVPCFTRRGTGLSTVPGPDLWNYLTLDFTQTTARGVTDGRLALRSSIRSLAWWDPLTIETTYSRRAWLKCSSVLDLTSWVWLQGYDAPEEDEEGGFEDGRHWSVRPMGRISYDSWQYAVSVWRAQNPRYLQDCWNRNIPENLYPRWAPEIGPVLTYERGEVEGTPRLVEQPSLGT